MHRGLCFISIVLSGLVLSSPAGAKHQEGWSIYKPHPAKRQHLYKHPFRLYQRYYRYHWVIRQYAGACLSWIIDHEDFSWDPHRWNHAGSGAYGLPQALPGSKMASAGRDWQYNPFTQVRWMKSYVKRYGGACQAKAYWLSHGSY